MQFIHQKLNGTESQRTPCFKFLELVDTQVEGSIQWLLVGDFLEFMIGFQEIPPLFEAILSEFVVSSNSHLQCSCSFHFLLIPMCFACGFRLFLS